MKGALFLGALAAAAAVAVAVSGGSARASATDCPASNPPNELVLAGGSGQTAQLGTPFLQSLQVALANTNGCPLTGNLAGINVDFAAPAGGASGVFAGAGSREAVVGTDAHGVATAPVFTANNSAGHYRVVAGSDYGSVGLDLDNTAAGLAAGIVATSGINQQAAVNGEYAQPLQARVTDINGNPVQGATVSFSIVPGSTGAGASFLGGGQAGATTDSNGLATSPPLVANANPGRFTAVASADGLTTLATYTLDNHAAGQALIAPSGTAQSATIDSSYAKPLAARLVDSSGRPIEGASVTFVLGSASGNGTGGGAGGGAPGATFATGAVQATELTDANGLATSPRFTANGTTGRFKATAGAVSAGTPLAFALRNLPAELALRKPNASATVATRYRQGLVATVRTRAGRPIDGVGVTFSIGAASSGAGAAFPDGSKETTVLTDAKGEAATPRLLANTTAGAFTVTAAISGTTSLAGATLHNLAARPTAVTAGAASGEATPLSRQFPVPLAVTVADRYGNPVVGATVRFAAPDRGATGHFTIVRRQGAGAKARTARTVRVRTNANGIAVAPPFTAGDTPGGYTVAATVGRSTARASFALVNAPR